MKIRALLQFSLLLAVFYSATSYADSPTFSYIELEYIATGDFAVSDDNLDVELGLDGYALNIGAEFGIFLLQASRFELQSSKILGANLEDNISTIAFGLTLEFPRTNIYGLVRGRRDQLSLTGGGFKEDASGTSIGFEAGARVNLTDRFEVNANIGKPALDKGSSYGLGAQFFVTDNLGITLDLSSIELQDSGLRANFDTTSIGLRYNF